MLQPYPGTAPAPPALAAGSPRRNSSTRSTTNRAKRGCALGVDARANAIPRPPIVTVTVKPGDSLSAIAAAHGLTLKALLALPENAKYRAKPGLIHPGDVVRVK